jgi:hypothetical protein
VSGGPAKPAPQAFGGDLDEGRRALGVSPGLCWSCRHRDLLRSRTSTFLRCGRAATDARFVRYPPLPVVACAGFERPAEGNP